MQINRSSPNFASRRGPDYICNMASRGLLASAELLVNNRSMICSNISVEVIGYEITCIF